MNIFNVLSQGKSRLHETSMSAMLAYLLDPSQDHGIGNRFLKSFLELANEKNIYDSFLQEIETGQLKFDIDLEVQYILDEKRNDIDIQIKIFNKSNNELHRIIIENKIRPSAANTQQLTKYYKAVLNDKINDDVFELGQENLSVIFLTPESTSPALTQEFHNLDIYNKTWIHWYTTNNQKSSIVDLIINILKLEQEVKISPINEYMRHTFKAFAFFINQLFDKSKNRMGENIGNIKRQARIIIENQEYVIILRDSSQIQLLNDEGDKVVARSLLRKFLEENNVQEKKNCQTTRCFGKQVFDFLDTQG